MGYYILCNIKFKLEHINKDNKVKFRIWKVKIYYIGISRYKIYRDLLKEIN